MDRETYDRFWDAGCESLSELAHRAAHIIIKCALTVVCIAFCWIIIPAIIIVLLVGAWSEGKRKAQEEIVRQKLMNDPVAREAARRLYNNLRR